jgi:prepilin signal peptidase PulO-like enzyme (type II secretory pathway)
MEHETRPFPFGPSLVLGGFASVFAGDRLLHWYFGLMRG